MTNSAAFTRPSARAGGLLERISLGGLSDLLVVVPPVALLAAIASFYYASTSLRLVAVALQVGVFAYMAVTSESRDIWSISIGLFCLCLPFALLNCVATEYKSLIVPLCFLGGVGCSWYALECRKSEYIFEWPFIGLLVTTLYLILFRDYGMTEFNEIFAGASRNGYSAMLVALACAYTLSRISRGRRVSVTLIALAFACSFPLYGRSGIVSTALILAVVFAGRWPRLAVASVAILGIVVVLGYDAIALLVNVGTNFKSGLISDRWTILADYLAALNPQSLATGVSFDDILSIRENGNSPDIGFLRLHSYLGMSSMVFIAMYLLSAVEMVAQRHWVLLGLLIAVLLRTATDIIYMFGVFDFLFMPLLLFPYFRPLIYRNSAIETAGASEPKTEQ